MSDTPDSGTVERWCFDYVTCTDLDRKLRPPPRPALWESTPKARRLTAPGRPSVLVQARKSLKSPGPEALRAPHRRAQLAHTFWHHELQAAELMAWAVLAFPETPLAFRRGLLGILDDEVRHMDLYRAYMEDLGSHVGAFPIRDWFWDRIPSAPSPAAFVAVLGMGFEAGNLDHAARFAAKLAAIGDDVGAALEARVALEEIPHVRFALHWFEAFTGSVDFRGWLRALPSPLSPMVMRGKQMDLGARRRAGFSESFLDELGRWTAVAPGS
jgi:uncharacterized ferritin-like protein (DUF455 family)